MSLIFVVGWANENKLKFVVLYKLPLFLSVVLNDAILLALAESDHGECYG